MNKKTLVIGAGPSGLIAAYFAAKGDNNVTLLEKESEVGKKLLVTGNGRCNISNKDISREHYHGENPKFVESVFARFSADDTRAFFNKIGIELIESEKGKLFPKSNSAKEVRDNLEIAAKEIGASIELHSRVLSIKKVENNFSVLIENGSTTTNRNFDSIIITTGGKSYKALGSDGSGYELARVLGHKIIQPIPSSVPILSRERICQELQGVTLPVELSLSHSDNTFRSVRGDIIFTHYGISGPAVLSISRDLSKKITREKVDVSDITLEIDFVPQYSHEQMDQMVKERMSSNSERMICNQFYGICAKSLTNHVLVASSVDPALVGVISNLLIKNVIDNLKRYEIKVSGLLGWDHAQFTAGGVDTKEIDSRTMGSKIVPGLFFAGEVVDIDGDTGGFNLQWAWSSGALAGMSI